MRTTRTRQGEPATDDRHRDAPRPPPQDLLWWIATISLILPWVAAGVGLVGLARLSQGDNSGAWLLVLAVLLFALDVASDFWLHRAATRFNEEPGLNERASRDLGRRVLVEEAIVGGRGRVRLGDTLWMAQGPDLPVGTCVRIVGRRNSVLMVEPAPPRGKS